MATFAQTDRLLSLTSPLGSDVLLPDSFSCSEAISELFDLHLRVLVVAGTSVVAADLIGKRVTLSMVVDDSGTERHFNGMVATLESLGGDTDFDVYALRVVPMLWLLTLNTQTRVFQNKTVVDIVKEVLTTYSITPTDNTQATYTALEYCTQYRETDFAFVSRLLAQHGIFYTFTHTASDHTVVLGDTSAQLPDCTTAATLRYAPEQDSRSGFYEARVTRFALQSRLATGKSNLWDYRFSQFAVSASSAESDTKAALGANAHEQYDYADGPSAYLKTDSGDGNVVTVQTQFQNVVRDIFDSESVSASGDSLGGTLQSGMTFTLTEYPHASANQKYLLTRVGHTGRQRPGYRAEDDRDTSAHYSNSFEAKPSSGVYRPPQVFSKPRVQGVVTGKVVAPSGDESYLDKYGRVCVQFWWDRTRKPNTTDNTLLRVAQQWAGKGWGTYFWPRLGDEVLIDFLDGDPDAPIVVGSLYNGTNMPTYDPATQYTRAGIHTKSSKQGGAANSNELRFDDLKGSEQIFINAEKDFDIHVENDWHNQIDNDHHVTIKNNHYDAISGESHSKVTKDRFEEIGGAAHKKITGAYSEKIGGNVGEDFGGEHMLKIAAGQHITVGAALNEKIGADYSLQVTGGHNVKAATSSVDATGQVHLKGANVVIEASASITLSGPGGFIVIGPSGLMIQGIQVLINSGGAALPAVPAVLMSPQAPTAPTAPTAPKWPGDDPRSS